MKSYTRGNKWFPLDPKRTTIFQERVNCIIVEAIFVSGLDKTYENGHVFKTLIEFSEIFAFHCVKN